VLFVDYIINHLRPRGRAGIIVPEGIIFQSGTAYKQLRKNLVEEGLYAVASLPSGVFAPYSGVKTSILFFNNELAKTSREILFVKIEQDGFDLGAQRRVSIKNDLPQALTVLNKWNTGEKVENKLAVYVEKSKIGENGEYNLSVERYRIATDYTNAKWSMVKLEDVCDVYQPKTITSNEIKESGKYKVFGANGVIGYFDEYNHEESEVAVTCRGATCGTINFTEPRSWITGNAMVIKPKENNLNKRYLFFLLRSTDLSSVITGAAQPQITGSALKPFLIPLPPLEIQGQIVAELDGYTKIIEGAKQIVRNWKPKIDIDPAWEKVKLGEVCEIYGGGTPSRTEEKYWGGAIPWLSARYFSDDHRIKGSEMITELGLKNSSSKIAPKGSTILITRVSVGKFAIADQDYAINQDLTALESKGGNLDAKYLWLVSEIVAKKIKDNAVGVGVTGVTRDFVVNQEIPLPSHAVQKQIVEKIEAERAHVESANKLIAIYEQKTKEVISKLWQD
jgi:type I restriction enzyme M protein